VIVAGALIAAAGVWYLSRIPVRGTYPADPLPGLVITAIGIGAVLVSVTTAANAGVAEDKAGLAAGLLNASQQLGTVPGLAIFSAIATARTSAPLTAHARPAAAASPSPTPPAPVPPASRFPPRSASPAQVRKSDEVHAPSPLQRR
jgi:hypothetical protein